MHVEGSRSQTIMGVSPGVFKLNKTGGTHRKKRRVSILHLGPVKPEVTTTAALFTLLTPMAAIQAGEFFYEAPGGYLTIVNVIDIELSLIADESGADHITTSPVAASVAPALVVSTAQQV